VRYSCLVYTCVLCFLSCIQQTRVADSQFVVVDADTANCASLIIHCTAAGGELLQAVAEKGSYSEADARGCFVQLLSGIAYLHEQGVAHRDIKLENLLLDKKGDISHIRIVDFGLAKGHVEQNYLQMDTICGTPHYVAPEIIAVRAPMASAI
jgi:serine/threonine protein kinase